MFIEYVSFRPRPNCAEVWTMRGLTLKMHQMLTVHNTLKKLENTAILTILVLSLCKTRVRKSHHYHEVIILEKLCFKMHGFPSTLKRKPESFLWVEARAFWKSSVFVTDYCWRQNKSQKKLAASSNFYSVDGRGLVYIRRLSFLTKSKTVPVFQLLLLIWFTFALFQKSPRKTSGLKSEIPAFNFD